MIPKKKVLYEEKVKKQLAKKPKEENMEDEWDKIKECIENHRKNE